MTPYYSEPGIDLYLGDNREVLAELGLKPEDVALLWGDPPYGIRLETQRASRPAKWSPIAGDDGQFDPRPWLSYPRTVLWGANHYASRLPDAKGWMCWDKATKNDLDLQQAEIEFAWTNFLVRPLCFRHMWSGAFRDSERGVRVHPTQKPEALVTWGFRRAGLQPGQLVLSPWLGSGPEAAAAKRLGLRFIGIELVQEYLDACVDRLRQGVLPLGGAP